jgi:hypothetical protein
MDPFEMEGDDTPEIMERFWNKQKRIMEIFEIAETDSEVISFSFPIH